MTMSDAARSQQQQQFAAAAPVMPRGPSIIQGAPSQGSRVDIHPHDILPQAASDDPRFKQGLGSHFAIHQDPELVKTYGVLRDGKLIPPGSFRGEGGRGALSQETVLGIQAMQEAQARAAQQSEDAQVVEKAKSGTGHAAGQIAAPPPNHDVIEETISRNVREGRMDEIDAERVRDMFVRDLLNSEEQMKSVESRLEPLSLAKLIADGYVKQRVPIVPGVYEPTFVSYDGELDSNVKRMIFQERFKMGRPDLERADRYFIDRFSMMALTAGLHSINTTEFPSVLDANDDFDEAKFMMKFKRVLKLPFNIITSLCIHFEWFDLRVRRLLKASDLKNS